MNKNFIVDIIKLNNVNYSDSENIKNHLDSIENENSNNNNENSKLFISFDGRGDISEFIKSGAVFTSVIDNTLYHDIDKKFIDLFISINSKFFILNPRSTFSWQVYLIRICLGLESVPILNNKDLYVRSNSDNLAYQKDGLLWVSWVSVVEIYDKIKNII